MKPTFHPPGSAAKMAVLTERFRRCEPLFHEQDRTLDGILSSLLFPDGIPCHAEPAACRRARRGVAFHHGDGHHGEAAAASGTRVVRLLLCRAPAGRGLAE